MIRIAIFGEGAARPTGATTAGVLLAALMLVAGAPLAAQSSGDGAHKPGDIQAPKGTWQTPGDIKAPTGPWQKPGEIQVPKGIQAIHAQASACEQRLATVADALFEFDKATLNPDAEQTLSVLGPEISKLGQHPTVIEGHTDSIGTDAHNQRLSEQRAAAVRTWLAAHRFVAATTPIRGYGKSHPIAPNTRPDGSDDPAGRQKNRRVEVVVKTCP
jgi:outer membrane protein OmpA-like peptidoglycan-associated protein